MKTVLSRIALALVLLLGASLLPATAAAADSGPPLLTPASTLAQSLSCSGGLATSTSTPILLVPGTVESSEQAYSWGYQKVLRAQGHPVCVITRLPNYGGQDMQTTAEWVVSALRYMHQASGRKVSVLGHSQGGMLIGWALRFWPDLASTVDDAIFLASPDKGTDLSTWGCGLLLGHCPPFLLQLRPGSNLNTALAREPLPSSVSVTSIGSGTDELVFPEPSVVQWKGATNIQVQDVCPGRVVGHMGLLQDAAAYALVNDALTHPGTADLSRVGRASCEKGAFDGVDSTALAQLLPVGADIVKAVATLPYVTKEPPLRDYARAASQP